MKNIKEKSTDFVFVIIIEIIILGMISKEYIGSSINYVDALMTITLPLYIYIIIMPLGTLILLKRLSRVNKNMLLIRYSSTEKFWSKCVSIIIKSSIVYSLIYHVPMFILCRIKSRNMGKSEEWIIFGAVLWVFISVFIILGIIIQLLCYKFGTSAKVVLITLGCVYLFSFAARIFPDTIPNVLMIENLMIANIIQFQESSLIVNIIYLCIYMLMAVYAMVIFSKRLVKKMDILWR